MNAYEVVYKESAKSRKTFKGIRFARSIDAPSLTPEGCILVSARFVGEYVGDFCTAAA